MCTNGLTAQAFAGRLPATPSMRSVMVWIWTAVALLAAAPRVGLTQGNYPNRSIKIIVPIVPGTLPDTLARLIGDKLASKWGQAVIVENRGGASGNIGAEAVARSDPDGYTLLVSQPPPVAINQYLFAKLNFDPLAFAPVSIISTSPNVLVVHPKITANTIAELITYAKVGSCLPKWAQGFRVECLTLKLGGDDNAGEAELDGAPFEFGRRLLRIERWDVR
jgi:tripartite-type tricarboxylate transporter receptor subunit TctC